MFRLLCLTCLLAIACLPLGGCGVKGPLVLPDQATRTKQHKQPSAPANNTGGETSATNH